MHPLRLGAVRRRGPQQGPHDTARAGAQIGDLEPGPVEADQFSNAFVTSHAATLELLPEGVAPRRQLVTLPWCLNRIVRPTARDASASE
ncbi:hypothetical protein JCM9957A_42020 [Kineosporia succinea]